VSEQVVVFDIELCNFRISIVAAPLELCSVSTEFLGLMKKVAKSPLVMDVLNINNVQRQLERLADLLSKIQKALGEYLERERSSFPRYVISRWTVLNLYSNLED